MKIALRDIHVRVRAKTLFRLPALTFESDQRVLIQGESGQGKTTLLHLAAGLFLPAEGTVEAGKFKLTSMSDEQRCHFRRQHVGIIFQKLNLLEHLTARENVSLAIGESADARTRAEAALASVGLSARSGERSSVLSLGEQQRVAVARVLAGSAQVLLADEPTSSLDDRNATNVMDLLLTAAHGKTLIVVSHDRRIEKKFDLVLQFKELVRS